MTPAALASSAIDPEQISGLQSLSGALRGIDLLGLAILVLFLVLGALRGLWWQAIRLLGIIASVSVARALAPRLSPGLADVLPGLSPALANGIAWLGILIGGLLVVAMVGKIGRATLKAAQLGTLDRIGGAAVGICCGLLVHVVLLLCLCQLSPIAWASSLVQGTRSQALLETVAARFPVLLDVRAEESIERMRADPESRR